MWAKKALMSRSVLRVDQVFSFDTFIHKQTHMVQTNDL